MEKLKIYKDLRERNLYIHTYIIKRSSYKDEHGTILYEYWDYYYVMKTFMGTFFLVSVETYTFFQSSMWSTYVAIFQIKLGYIKEKEK